MILRSIVIVEVNYFRPDYRSLLQQFIWQTDDIIPEIPRVHEFLNYWKDHIDAVIQEVLVCTQGSNHTRHAIFHEKLN